MEVLRQYLHMSPKTLERLFLSAVTFGILWLLMRLAISITRRKVTDVHRSYHVRRVIVYTYAVLLLLLVGRFWIGYVHSLATVFGLMGAGLAIAMHDTIANIAGWFYIIWIKPFRLGDRIEIGDIAGDVIDIGLFKFSLVEIRNWVDADQSTGRIIHVPNSKALKEPCANYQTGFEYIWHEIPVLVTFESNWQAAKEILNRIADEKIESLSADAQRQVRGAAMKYLVFFPHLTPIVYLTVRDSGILLTLRYIAKPRGRRGAEQVVWEAILAAFAERDDIHLAYPTTRFYTRHDPANIPGGMHAAT